MRTPLMFDTSAFALVIVWLVTAVGTCSAQTSPNDDLKFLYEIQADGSGLKQLTDGSCDDVEPAYLPDGGIVFCSSRCNRMVNCWFTRVATLHRCDGDGSHVRALSANIEQDNTPWVLPDGRILYMRWEYVDRSQVQFHHLWTMNPDGTGQTVYFGNQHGGTVMLDAKPIPGTRHVVASFSPGHGQLEHAGYVTSVDPSNGPDDRTRARQVSREGYWRDPYALSASCFLVAGKATDLWVMDAKRPPDRELGFNLTRPEQSLALLAPLAPAAGGWGLCRRLDATGRPTGKAADVFASPADPDYQTILKGIVDAKARLDRIKRFDMPGFRPNESYVREMKVYGILPADWKDSDPLDVYQVDRRYWESHWYVPPAADQ